MDELVTVKTIEALRGAFGAAGPAGGWGSGFASGWFSVRELARALEERAARGAWPPDWAGEGGVGGGGGDDAGAGAWSAAALAAGGAAAARAAAGAALAGDVGARGGELCAAAGGLRLRLAAVPADGAPPPRLWFDAAALAALRMPYLTLDNIKGGRRYECERCGARFERPNPLKLHLLLRCAAPAPPAFWARALPRLYAATAITTAADTRLYGTEAFETEAEASATSATRRHACPFCGKLYSRRYGLKIHIRTHTGYKPLRCRYCARAFGDPSNLNKHVRLHAAHDRDEGGRGGAGAALRCGRCGQRAARRRDLLRHQRARHPPDLPHPPHLPDLPHLPHLPHPPHLPDLPHPPHLPLLLPPQPQLQPALS